MIRNLLLAAVIVVAVTVPVSAQSEELQIKSGLGFTATAQDTTDVLQRAVEAKVLTNIQREAYIKRLDDIRAGMAELKKDGRKPSFDELQASAKELATLTSDINAKLRKLEPAEIAVNPKILKDQYENVKTRVEGALSIGRLGGREANFYRNEAKKIFENVDMKDEQSIAGAARQLARLNSKLQIATARDRTAAINTNPAASFLFGARAF